jgi:succinate dehydrogenase / fumarate reductase, membrane anchor subunit
MSDSRLRGLNSGGLAGWFLQRLTGVLLVPVVLVHVWVTHYAFTGGFHKEEVSYNMVAARLASPWWKLIDIFFLLVVLYHGLRGIWIIVQEGIRRPWLRISLYSAILILGAVLAVLGTVTILPFRAPALTAGLQ